MIALDLGGTKLAGALASRRGLIGSAAATQLEGRKGNEVGVLIEEQTTRLLAAARQRKIKITALAISVPGISRRRQSTVWAPNIPGWENYPLQRRLQKLLGQSIPVQVESDRACYILGECWRGVTRGCRNAIFLAVGTGIGAGILIDGRVLRGAADIAGAIGWMALDRPYRPEYDACGCFEYHASGEGLGKVARSLAPERLNTARDVFAAANADPAARQVIEEAIQFWGMAVANLTSLFNPEKIVLGGGIFGPAKKFLPRIYAAAAAWAQPIAIRQMKLCASQLGGLAGLHGAAWLALEAERTKRDG